jgi:8-oxo-dGTP pyrophosphatase MutT (NUDIX family)
MKCVPSHALIVSCGCVIVDPTARKIAILQDPETNITQLPKGRKNINEEFAATALREAYEETGIRVTPLPLKIATRATPTEDMLHLVRKDEDGHPEDVTSAVPNCEPLAVCYHRCSSTLAYKLVFWYAAQGDSVLKRAEGTMEVWEHFQVEWVDARSAAGTMTMAADGEVIDKLLCDMVASGYDI